MDLLPPDLFYGLSNGDSCSFDDMQLNVADVMETQALEGGY